MLDSVEQIDPSAEKPDAVGPIACSPKTSDTVARFESGNFIGSVDKIQAGG